MGRQRSHNVAFVFPCRTAAAKSNTLSCRAAIQGRSVGSPMLKALPQLRLIVLNSIHVFSKGNEVRGSAYAHPGQRKWIRILPDHPEVCHHGTGIPSALNLL